MIRPIYHRATDRHIDIAAAVDDDIRFLADLHDNLDSHRHGLICETAVGSEHAREVYVVKRPSGGYSTRHWPGCRHDVDHDVIPESDEHKRGKHYAAGELERLGLPTGLEVRTDTRRILDVATLDSPRITAVEIQAYNTITIPAYKRRSTLIARTTAFTGKHARQIPAGGVLPLWVQAFGMPKGWPYPVPSVAAQDTRWDVMPKTGTVTCIGPRIIRAEKCRPGSAWPQCPVAGRNWCGGWHPWAEPAAGLNLTDVLGRAASGLLTPIRYHRNDAVYLVSTEHAALYAELGGNGTWVPGASERSYGRRLGPCPDARGRTPPPWQCRICGTPTAVSVIRCETCRKLPLNVMPDQYVKIQRLARERREQQGTVTQLRPIIASTPRRPGICNVPRCGQFGRLYPAGWRCDEHKPGIRNRREEAS